MKKIIVMALIILMSGLFVFSTTSYFQEKETAVWYHFSGTATDSVFNAFIIPAYLAPIKAKQIVISALDETNNLYIRMSGDTVGYTNFFPIGVFGSWSFDVNIDTFYVRADSAKTCEFKGMYRY
jgi:hypothetical protein